MAGQSKDWLPFCCCLLRVLLYFLLKLCSCSSFCVSLSDSDSCVCVPLCSSWMFLFSNVSWRISLQPRSFGKSPVFLPAPLPLLPFLSFPIALCIFFKAFCFSPILSLCLSSNPLLTLFLCLSFVLPFPLPFYLRLFFTINCIRHESLNFGSIYKIQFFEYSTKKTNECFINLCFHSCSLHESEVLVA